MKKETINILCGFGILAPLVLLFWPMPYIMWHPVVETILRMLPAISAQILFSKNIKFTWLKALPIIVTGILAGWGTLLYFTSDDWVDCTFIGLLTDYVSPFIGCVIVWGIWSLRKKKKPTNTEKE